MTLTTLQTRAAREIVALARRDNLRDGDHLVESSLAERIGISRSPVNAALRHLVERGLVTHDLNRGYFLRMDARAWQDIAEQLVDSPDEPLYLQIAQDRLSHRLPDSMSEADLMREYSVARSTLRNVLSRIQQEGWVEKQVGQGWLFLPLIDSAEAYEESYFFRAAIEPTGLLSSSFKPDAATLSMLMQRQRFIAAGGYETMTSIELFEANSEFHETLAKWSGNRFIAQSVRRMDQLRRLVEYSQAKDRKPRKLQALEHIAILEAIAQQDILKAASLLKEHLENARKAKVYQAQVFQASHSDLAPHL